MTFIEVWDGNTTPARKVILRADSVVRISGTSRGRGVIEYTVGNEAKVLLTDETPDQIMRLISASQEQNR